MLIIGYQNESTISHLLSFLIKYSIPHDFLDLSSISSANYLEISASKANLTIQIDQKLYSFREYGSFYCRYYYKNMHNHRINSALTKIIELISRYLRSTKDQIVVNTPTAGFNNYNKYIHVRKLSSFGFKVPQTMICGSPTVAQEYIKHNECISKSISSAKTRVDLVDKELIHSLSKLKSAPSQFQEFIRGKDVRIHIVDGYPHALCIESQVTDYRFSSSLNCKNRYSITRAPESIIEMCNSYCLSENLLLAGFDFKLTDDDQWYILECNPMPGYDYFDRHLDLSITRSLVKLLLGNRTSSHCTEAIKDISISEPYVSSSRRPDLINMN